MRGVAFASSNPGLGRAVLHWAESRIQRTGRDLARLDCIGSNQGLRRSYEATGYRVVGCKDFNEDPSASSYKPIPSLALWKGPGTDEVIS